MMPVEAIRAPSIKATVLVQLSPHHIFKSLHHSRMKDYLSKTMSQQISSNLPLEVLKFGRAM
jgi:hypothetical protein